MEITLRVTPDNSIRIEFPKTKEPITIPAGEGVALDLSPEEATAFRDNINLMLEHISKQPKKVSINSKTSFHSAK